MKNWVWSVTTENWSIVKNKKIWVANTNNENLIVKGDKMIFYVKGTRYFQGIYKVISDWNQSDTNLFSSWNAKDSKKLKSQIKLELIQLGYASLRKLTAKLEFIENEKTVGVYLRGSRGGPANFGRHISEQDYELICDELKNMQEKSFEDETPESFNDEELILVKSWDFIEKRIHVMKSPNLNNIDDIIRDANKGKYGIPQFQRPYTWKRKQIEELWESIFQGFFIGSILTWKSEKEIKVSPIHGVKSLNDDHEIILDGQQRITSLHYAVMNPEEPLPDHSPMLFFINIRELLNPDAISSNIIFSEFRSKAMKKGLLNKEEQFAKKIFPLTAFNNHSYNKWIYEFKDYLINTEKLNNADQYTEKIEDILNHVWSKYQIPIIQLSNSIHLDDVADIFEKINSKGTRLNVFDLLNARFNMYGINLRDEWDKIKEEYDNIKILSKNIDDIEKYIIQGMCLYKNKYIRRKELFRLDKTYTELKIFQKEKFLDDWKNISEQISKAITKLRSQNDDGFGAIIPNTIPYTVVIPILAAMMNKTKNLPDEPRHMLKIEKWYWSTVISDNYSSSTDTNIENDYKEMLAWFEDDKNVPTIVIKQKNIFDETDLKEIDLDTARTSNSIYKTIMCLIAKNDARDFVKNKSIGDDSLDDHHIFPKSLVDNYDSNISFNSILNRTLIYSETNRKYIKNKKPKNYIKKIMDEQKFSELELRKRLKPHFISDKAFDYLLQDDFDGFVKERKNVILEKLRILISDI